MTLARLGIGPEKEIPAGAEVVDQGRLIGRRITPGRSLFLREKGVGSEAEYKRRCAEQRQIMYHAHIGWRSWETTIRGLERVYRETTARGGRIDRFGICLDWTMGLPEEVRDRAHVSTGLILRREEEWRAVADCVPVQPHFGDHMIGSPASVENTRLALEVGATTIGNLGQYFTFRYPGWDDEAARAVSTVQALAMMGEHREMGALVHSNLDDGFGSQFIDLATLIGWAMIECYIVENLTGARLVHCYGHFLSDPVKRAAFLLALDEVHDGDTAGSMVYGNTTSYGEDSDRNVAALTNYILVDQVMQLKHPTGHALTPVPLSEAFRIPTAEEIIQVQVMAAEIGRKAEGFSPLFDETSLSPIKGKLLEGGRSFYRRVLEHLQEIEVDIRDPIEMLLALKEIGPVRLERAFGSRPDAKGSPLRALVPTDTVLLAETRHEELKRALGLKPGLMAKVSALRGLIGATDVHQYGRDLIKVCLEDFGALVLDAGVNLTPEKVAAVALETSPDFIAISTYNGLALGFARQLLSELGRIGIKAPVFMGGKLNQNVEGDLPRDVRDDLEAMGIIACRDLQEFFERLESTGCPQSSSGASRGTDREAG